VPLAVLPPGRGSALRSRPATAAPSRRKKLVARDSKNNPLFSSLAWTDEAVERVFRVPAGFMRAKTQERIEELARERAAATIDLTLVEDGIELGKQMMAEMIATYKAPGAAASAPATAAPASTPSSRGYLNEVTRLSTMPPPDEA
jgi:hypothetical protein